MKQFENDLTIHLYRKDEALASMRWGILNHCILETIFWGLELYDSDFQQDALQMLEFVWISSIGFGSWSAIQSIFDIYQSGELNRDYWISLLLGWTRIPVHDSTIFNLLLRGSMICDIPVYPHENEFTSLSSALENCIKRSKLLESWLIGRALPVEDQWKYMLKYASNRSNEIQALKILSPIENLAAAYALVTLSDEQWKEARAPLNLSVSDEIKKTISEWDSLGFRERRIYKVKPEAIMHLSSRSSQSVYESNDDDLQDNLEITLKSSSFWRGLLSEYMDPNGFWKSDRSKEEFYDTYFTDDIPDEWSKSHREQSHGRGNGVSEELARQKFIKTLIQKSTSSRINIVETESTMEWQNLYESNRDELYTMLSSKLPFKPVKKEFLII